VIVPFVGVSSDKQVNHAKHVPRLATQLPMLHSYGEERRRMGPVPQTIQARSFGEADRRHRTGN
jgi:hypothetical protein